MGTPDENSQRPDQEGANASGGSSAGEPAAEQPLDRAKKAQAYRIAKTRLDVDVSNPPGKLPRMPGPASPADPTNRAAQPARETPRQSKNATSYPKISRTRLDVEVGKISFASKTEAPSVEGRTGAASAGGKTGAASMEGKTGSASVEGKAGSASVKGGQPSQSEKPKLRAPVLKTRLDIDICRNLAKSAIDEASEKAREQALLQPPAPPVEFKPIAECRKASDCESKWEKMTGETGCSRFCEKCQSLVYDFSTVELEEARQIILKREGKTDPVLFRRADGKFLSRDCPIGAARRKTIIASGLFAIIATVAIILVLCPRPSNPVIKSVGSAPPVKAVVVPTAAEQPPESKKKDTEPEPEPAPAQLKKAKFHFDRALYVNRIKSLKKRGYDCSIHEKALMKIESDINAGKHQYYIQPQLDALAESLGLSGNPSSDLAAGAGAAIRIAPVNQIPGTTYHAGIGLGLGGVAARKAANDSVQISGEAPLIITEFTPGGAASASGLQVGDQILMIDREKPNGMTLPQARARLGGLANSRVNVTVMDRTGAIRTLVLVRTIPVGTIPANHQ